MSATLGIATVAYLPFAFFNIINLVIIFLFAILGIKISRTKPGEPAWRDIGGQRLKGTEHEKAVAQG